MSELDELALDAWTSGPRAAELWKRARKHGEMLRSAATVEWVRKKGYETETTLDRNALEWAALGLALHGDPRVVPFLVSRARERWDFARLLLAWLETDRVDRPRLAAAVRSWLDDEESSVHDWKVAARCLAYVGTPDDAPAVCRRLGECFDAMWSPDASMTVRMEEHATSLGESLRRSPLVEGIPRSFFSMLEGVVSVESHSIDRARGTAARLLAAHGSGLDAIARGLRWQLDHGGHPSRVTPGQLLAVGALGKTTPAEVRAGLGRAIECVRSDSPVSRRGLAGALALHDLGIPGPPPTTVAADLLAKSEYSSSDVVRNQRFVLECTGERAELPVEPCVPFLFAEDTRLHRAAYRALRARRAGALPEVRPIDACTLHMTPPEALRALVADPAAMPTFLLAAHLARHPDPEAADALASAHDRLLARRAGGIPGDDGESEVLRALLRTGSPAVHDRVARAIEQSPERVPLDDVPSAPGLTTSVVRLFTKTKEKRLREAARAWITRHLASPDVRAALEAVGLLPEDFTRRSR